MSGEEDLEYVSQLQRVFDSCDTSATGTLNREELLQLCEKLEFESQAQILIDRLLGDDPQSGVDFVHFKDAFIAVLSETMESSEDEDDKVPDTEGTLSDTDRNEDHPSPHHTPPSRQELVLRLSPLQDDDDEGDLDLAEALAAGKSPKSRSTPRASPGASPTTSPKMVVRISPSASPDLRTDVSPISYHSTPPPDQSETAETFEAEGLMEPPTADGDLAIEEHRHHMHLLWQDLGVGKRGFLTMDELASVCKKIGLEQMNNEEIQQMFDKLDVDCDGRVSFDEFVHGLFRYGGPNAILSPSRQLSSTPRQKLRRALSRQMEEQRQTPSLITSGSGLFSALDIDNTGYAKPEDIIALWESFGISQGAEILEYLQFSLTCKINLMELSYALEQEMRSVEEDNATYQAAIASYDYELRFLKQQTEHLVAERNKLKADLTEINNRVTLLVKEGDERYSLLEKSKEKETAELEKKYQDQIRSLQSELDRERETFYNQSSNEAQKLQSTLNNLKEEETRLKDRVASVQRDYDRLEQENRDMAEKYAELESKKERLQRDLEATAELQHKLEEMESSRDLFIDEHERFSEQQLHQLQAENKELKDKADEMTVQIEELHQQVLAHKRHFGYLAGHHGGEGSMEYSSLFRGDNYSPQGTGDEASEDDVDNVRVRRKLPRRPDDGQPDGEKGSNIVSLLAEKLQDEVNELRREKESLLSQHQLELQSLERQNHENTTLLMNHNQEQMKMQQTEFERKLNALQEEHDKVVQSIRKDHQEIIKSLEGHYQERLKKQKQAYESQLEQEQSETTRRLKALRDDHELELTLLQSKHEERVEKLEREHAEKISEATQLEGGIREYEDKVKVMEVKHAQDLKELQDKFHEAADEKENRHVEELQQMKEEYENKMNALESRHAEELEALQEEHEKRTKEMESQHEEVVDSLQTEHDEEVRGLQQKLEGLCSESSIKTEEVMALQRGFSLERKDIEDAYKMEIAEMEDRHMQEVNELLKEARREKEKVEAEFECRLKEKLEEQETKIRQELEQEKQDLMIKMESEKNLLRVDFEKEKERLVTEHQLDVAKKEAEIQKLEGKTKMQVEELEKQKAAYELQLKLQREESELEFRKEKLNMVERFDEEKSKLLEKHRSDIYEYENIFVKGTDGLRGKLHGDFFRLLEEHKQKEEDKLQTKLEEELQKEKQHLVEQLTKENATRLEETIREKELVEQEKDLLIRDLDAIRDRQKVEAEEERRRIIDELTKEKELLEQEWMAEKDRLNADHQRELQSKQELVDDLQRQVAVLEEEKTEVVNEKRALEVEHSARDLEQSALWEKAQNAKQQELQTKLEEEFLQQMDQVKKAFLEEREQLEDEVKYLKQELEQRSIMGAELERRLREAEQLNDLLEERASQYKRQTDDLSRAIAELKEENRALEEERRAMKKQLEDRIDQLLAEKEEAQLAARVQALQSSARPDGDLDKDVILREIDSQKRLLVDRTNNLENQIERLHKSRDQNLPLQLANQRLLEENQALERALQEKTEKLKEKMEQSLSAEDYKTRASSTEEERDALRQQLQLTAERLTSANTALSLARSEHQRELGALRQQIGNMVDPDKHRQVKKQLVDAQNRLGQLEAALEKRAAETTKVIMGMQADHKHTTERLEEEKEGAEQRTEQLQQLLDQQVDKLKQQLEKSSKTDMLVKDLYVENSQLVRSLYLAEKREKDAEKRANNLEDKCRDYMRLIRKLTQAAME